MRRESTFARHGYRNWKHASESNRGFHALKNGECAPVPTFMTAPLL